MNAGFQATLLRLAMVMSCHTIQLKLEDTHQHVAYHWPGGCVTINYAVSIQ
jgi:hypothetical protein